MFEWLFGKKKNDGLRDLSRVLKNGITINVKISGNLNVEQERGDTLEKGSRECPVDASSTKVEQNTEGSRKEETIDAIPDFKKLKKPKVSFGEEKEA